MIDLLAHRWPHVEARDDCTQAPRGHDRLCGDTGAEHEHLGRSCRRRSSAWKNRGNGRRRRAQPCSHDPPARSASIDCARIRGTDSSANAHAGGREPLDAGGVGRGCRRSDQHLPSPSCRFGGRGRATRRRPPPTRISDRRARLRRRRRRRTLAPAPLGDDIDAFTEAPDRVRHERNAAFATCGFLERPTHRAKLSHRAGRK